MLFSALILIVASALTTAQNVGPYVLAIPKCGLACLEEFIPQVCGKSGLFNYTCQCENQAAISKLATPCIKGNCTSQEQLDVLAESLQICEVVNADLVASANSAAATAGGTAKPSMTATTSAIPFGQSGYALTTGPVTFVPSGNAAWPAATAGPIFGAGLAALAWAAL